jgi:hypothetical protein
VGSSATGLVRRPEDRVADMSDLTIEPIWYIKRRFRPNLDPASFISWGTLTVHDGVIDFRPTRPPGKTRQLIYAGATNDAFQLKGITKVGLKRYGWGVCPRFVFVESSTENGQTRSYFNDGAWQGWRPLLTRSNRTIAESIRQALALK